MKAHICFNCKLPIQEDEAEIKMSEEEMNRVRARLSKSPLVRRADDAPIRYRHETYEICSAVEAREASW